MRRLHALLLSLVTDRPLTRANVVELERAGLVRTFCTWPTAGPPFHGWHLTPEGLNLADWLCGPRRAARARQGPR